MGGPSRFVNNSCNPNCNVETLAVDTDTSERLLLVANRDIAKGEELTITYE